MAQPALNQVQQAIPITSDRPFVTVVLPTFNRSHIVTQVLETICAQDYPKDFYEIIVVDNNSSDGTEAIIKRFALGRNINIRYVKEARPGLVFARHTGAANAKGNIVLYGDDDAFYEPNWISAVVDVYERHPEVGAVGTSIEIRWDKPPSDWVRLYEPYLGQINYGTDCVVGVGLSINGGSFSVKKDILLSLKGFHPGQKGEYILGDSENGLCRKLATAKIPVGCTAKTTAWHFQLAEKNGTFKDLRRRLHNNGICQAYEDTFYGKSLVRVSFRMMRQALHLVRDGLRRILRGDSDHLKEHLLLRWYELSSRVQYCVLYRMHAGIRSEVGKRDWEFGPHYVSALADYISERDPALRS
jgi:glycosyltransferase involved in cell wall biosynthesis